VKLNYKVLWVDDREDSLPPIQQPIEDYLDGLGFRLVVVWRKDGSNVESLAADPELDLIIMDQNLGPVPGDELIRRIRQHEKFVEIILYSQDPATNLRDKDAGLDGIYRTHRNDIEKVLKRVIDRTIRKTQDLNVMRGLVIAETIDIENQIERMMVRAFEDKGQFFQEKVLDRLVYDFAKKWGFLCGLMNDLVSAPRGSSKKDTEPLQQLHKVLKKMDSEVLDVRNILAHSRVEYDENGKAHLRGLNKRTKGLEPNAAWCRTMRKTLLKHEDNLARIRMRLYGEDQPPVVPPKDA
jgi:CheY-like chemotaxis protein